MIHHNFMMLESIELPVAASPLEPLPAGNEYNFLRPAEDIKSIELENLGSRQYNKNKKS
jgi:hypothetical protein